MDHFKHTPPTATTTSSSPYPFITINQFQDHTLSQLQPSSNPFITLQLNISQLQDSKKRLIYQLQNYQNRISKVVQLQGQNNRLISQNELLKDENINLKNKSIALQRQCCRLKSIVKKLQQAIQRSAKQSQYKINISEEHKHLKSYQNTRKYFQGLQQKSLHQCQKQIQEMNNKIYQLRLQNQQLQSFIIIRNGPNNSLNQTNQFLVKFENNNKKYCENRRCINKNIYIKQLLQYLNVLSSMNKKQIQVMKKQVNMFLQQFKENKNNISKINAKRVIEKVKSIDKQRSKSKQHSQKKINKIRNK